MPISENTITKYHGVKITYEMKNRAKTEAEKREAFIKHHFIQTDHLYSFQEIMMIGFFGEFAARILLDLDWRTGIRPNYETIDSNDILINKLVIDIKTESIPERYVWDVITKKIKYNEYYGNRLYHAGQKDLIAKYDIIFMGTVIREDNFNDINAWFPIGWIYAENIQKYPCGKKGPIHWMTRHRIQYPFAAFQIPTYHLRGLDELREFIQTPKS
ncbi:hypothetical protein [Candidatus Borrarchaeum sp.]|uniref:hypothetical protein n=1 Tax=Candidatus Borrarchaeum sp. TaxID=2846742 RepID=UPI0025804EED|nr:hypothetical protein [Candidatus Borrarchaeum sp.]